LCFSIAKTSRIREASGDFFKAIELREIGFVGDSCNEHFAAFFGRADTPDFNPGTLAGKQAEIIVDVLGVIENIRRTHNVMERRIGRRNARAQRKMVDEFGAEKGFRGELFDFFGVFRMVLERARTGLCQARSHTETQREKNTKQAARHETPQGDTIAGDFIDCFSRGRNPIALHVDDAGHLAYDWPPVVRGIEERDGWKNN
jgi:hypothetical protein